MSTTNLLHAVRVVDMTTVMFGPYCTSTLASLGADVIKIEPPGGDELRRVGRPAKTKRMGPAHLTMNRGKRSVAWDLKSPDGREALQCLLRTAQVFIHNLRGEAALRAKLDYASVKEIQPNIVYVQCSGFGSTGPYGGDPAYDDIIQSASGAATLIPQVNGGGAPTFLPLAVADKVSGLHAVSAVLAALYHRERTGEGQFVEVPMFESFTHFLLQEHLYGRTFANPTEKSGYPRQLDPDRQPMRTTDGYITVAPYTDDRWLRFFKLVERSDVLDDPRLSTPIERLRNLSLLQKAMSTIIATRPTQGWLDLLHQHDIPVARVNTIDDLFEDPHLSAVGFFGKETHPTEGDYVTLDPPMKFSGGEPIALRPAATIGQHSEEILAELGFVRLTK